MEIQSYLDKKKKIYDIFLRYIDSSEDSEESEDNFQFLIREYDEQKIKENKNELHLFLKLLSKVQNNHHRCPGFVNRMQQLLLRLKNDITQNFTNSEIYNILKSDKLIVLFLIKQNFIKVDQSIADLIIKVSQSKIQFSLFDDEEYFNDLEYLHYFYPEIKPFIDELNQNTIKNKLFEYNRQIFDKFEENREKGENEFYISKLIRNDSVEEFIFYINKNNISVNSQIKPSIFETNSFLFSQKKITLIEYAAFFGSIRILQYLHQNDARISPSIWLYAIHSQNPIIIDFLQQKGIQIQDMKEVICESIKCHHNNIARYFMNMIDNLEENNEYKSNPIFFSFRYFNYEIIPSKLNNIKYVLHYACKYSYPILVNFLTKDDKIDVNEEVLVSEDVIETPLNISSKKKNLEIVDILLKNPRIEIGVYALKGLENITEITIPSSSKIIGKSAFEGCTSLVHVVIPSSVTKIDDLAFLNCTSLVKVVDHSKITEYPTSCFENCKSLKEINIPTSVKHLGQNAFLHCESLEEIEIPSSVETISCSTFCGCKSLKKLNLPPSVVQVLNDAFSQCDSLVDVVINSKSISLIGNCFSSCKSLKNVTFDKSSKVVIGNAFIGCSSLERFEIPPFENKFIIESTFKDCTSLKEVIIPSTIKTISRCAFYNCISLKKIVIPSSVEEIEPLAFAKCSNLNEIIFESPCSLVKIESSIFDSCTSLTDFIVPSSVKIMKDYIFYNCSSLKKVVFENPCGVEEIGSCIFRDCNSLSEFEIPPSVEKIGSLAFMNCSSLSKLIIHPSLKVINENAFKGCDSLTSISLPSSIDIANLGLDQGVKITPI